jgi:hypothetical protein
MIDSSDGSPPSVGHFSDEPIGGPPAPQPPTSADPDPKPVSVTRRTALKVIATAAALPVLAAEACEPGVQPGATPVAPNNPMARGTPADPDLVAPTVPWDGVLGDDELRTVRALCDVILPADDRSPAASSIGVVEFIDEWIGAPYPSHLRDQVRIRGGLVWLNTEANERFGLSFADLDTEQQHAICDDICYAPDATPEFRPAALFFDRFRDLTATGFWTTTEGMTDLGYIGNVPMASWDGPPEQVLRNLGLV